MKIHPLLASICSIALAADAFAYGGTSEQTIAAGGSFSYEPSTEHGSTISVEGRGGYYIFDGFQVGGLGSIYDNDVTTTYEFSAYCQYHLFRLVNPDNDSPGGFSPYVAARLGLAHGKNDYGDSATGALIAARFGIELFFTENVALDISADAATCTGDVYPDDYRLKGSDVSVAAGLMFHF